MTRGFGLYLRAGGGEENFVSSFVLSEHKFAIGVSQHFSARVGFQSKSSGLTVLPVLPTPAS